MATKKQQQEQRIFKAEVRKAANELLKKRAKRQAKKIAPLGGVARWKGIPPKERSRLMKAASAAGAAGRAKYKARVAKEKSQAARKKRGRV